MISFKILSKVHLKISIDQTFSTNKPVLICTIRSIVKLFKKKRYVQRVVRTRGEGGEVFFNRYANRDLEEFG